MKVKYLIVLTLFVSGIIKLKCTISNNYSTRRELLVSNIKYIKLYRFNQVINICHIACYDNNNINQILNKSVTVSSIYDRHSPAFRVVNGNDSTECTSYSDFFHTLIGAADSWILVEANNLINVEKCIILNRFDHDSIKERLNGVRLSLIDANNNELAFRIIKSVSLTDNKVIIEFKPIIVAQYLYFKYNIKNGSVTNYFTIQINKSTSLNGLTSLEPNTSATINDSDFKYLLQVYEKTDGSYTYSSKYLQNDLTYGLYKIFLPHFVGKYVNDTLGNPYYYVIWLINGTSNFISCTRPEFKSKFNIKLFKYQSEATDFYENITQYLNPTDVILKKYLFNLEGSAINSFSTNTTCEHIIRDCLIGGNCSINLSS